jgi:hypothetical protein
LLLLKLLHRHRQPEASVAVLYSKGFLIYNQKSQPMELAYFLSHPSFHELLNFAFDLRHDEVASTYSQFLKSVTMLFK